MGHGQFGPLASLRSQLKEGGGHLKGLTGPGIEARPDIYGWCRGSAMVGCCGQPLSKVFLGGRGGGLPPAACPLLTIFPPAQIKERLGRLARSSRRWLKGDTDCGLGELMTEKEREAPRRASK